MNGLNVQSRHIIAIVNSLPFSHHRLIFQLCSK